jgi:hypothetical protein
MRNLILKMNLSTDGFVGGPKGEIDWIFRNLDDAKTWIVDTLWQVAKAGARWGEPRIASRDLGEEIALLKRERGKDIVAHGGAGFARSLVASAAASMTAVVPSGGAALQSHRAPPCATRMKPRGRILFRRRLAVR